MLDPLANGAQNASSPGISASLSVGNANTREEAKLQEQPIVGIYECCTLYEEFLICSNTYLHGASDHDC